MLKPCDHQASFCDSGVVVSGPGGSGDSRVRSRLVALQVAAGAGSQLRGSSAGERPAELAVAAAGDDCGESKAGSRELRFCAALARQGGMSFAYLWAALRPRKKVYEQRF